MTFFLDGLLGLLALYLVTQIVLPMLFPSDLERNWLFKKKTSTDDKISGLNDAKRNFSDKVDDALTEADRKRNEANELKKSTKKN